MILFFTVTLTVSIVGMIVLLSLKRWELSTGHVLGGSIRPKVGAFTQRALVWVEYALPSLMRQGANNTYRYLQVVLHRLAALSVVLVERGLEKFLKGLRHKTQVRHSDTEASAFLREVSAHKKQLLKSSRTKRAIYEE